MDRSRYFNPASKMTWKCVCQETGETIEFKGRFSLKEDAQRDFYSRELSVRQELIVELDYSENPYLLYSVHTETEARKAIESNEAES